MIRNILAKYWPKTQILNHRFTSRSQFQCDQVENIDHQEHFDQNIQILLDEQTNDPNKSLKQPIKNIYDRKIQNEYFDMNKLYTLPYYRNWALSPLNLLSDPQEFKQERDQNQLENNLLKFQKKIDLNMKNMQSFKIGLKQQMTLQNNFKKISEMNYINPKYRQYILNAGYHYLPKSYFNSIIQQNDEDFFWLLYKNKNFNKANFLVFQDLNKLIEQGYFLQKQNQFIINLAYLIVKRQYINKNKIKIVSNITKNFLILMQNFTSLKKVNLLKAAWAFFKVHPKLSQYTISITLEELTHLQLPNYQKQQAQLHFKQLINIIYGQKMCLEIVECLLNLSQNYETLLKSWFLIILLLARLPCIELNRNKNKADELTDILTLFTINLPAKIYKELLHDAIPTMLYFNKHTNYFEIYRQNLKKWLQKQPAKHVQKILNISSLDKCFNNIDKSQYLLIQINYPKIQLYDSTCTQIFLSKKTVSKVLPEQFNQKYMVKQLSMGNYEYVINYFMVNYFPVLSEQKRNNIQKMIKNIKNKYNKSCSLQAKQILKQINYILINFATGSYLTKQMIQSRKKIYLQQRNNKQNKKNINVSKEKYPQQEKSSKKTFFQKKNIANFCSFSTQNVNFLNQNSKNDLEFHNMLSLSEIQSFLSETKNQDKSRVINKLINSTIPQIGNGFLIFKYMLFHKKQTQAIKNTTISSRLKVSFLSSLGVIQKDYTHYIAENKFQYAFADIIYQQLLKDQSKFYKRSEFKIIISHLIAYRSNLTDNEVILITKICANQKIGLTLLEITYLFLTNSIQISPNAMKILSNHLQQFKAINDDILDVIQKYCESIQIQFELQMISSYCRSLFLQQNGKKLSRLCQALLKKERAKSYILNSNLSFDQNVKAQSHFKKLQEIRENKKLFDICNMFVQCAENKVPQFIIELFEQYLLFQEKLFEKDYKLGFIVFSRDASKFSAFLKNFQNQSTQKHNLNVLNSCIKAIKFNTRQLQPYLHTIMDLCLFRHQVSLNEQTIMNIIELYKKLSNNKSFIDFLEYLLLYQPLPMNVSIKTQFYFIMNLASENLAKNNIKGLLDLIFNKNKQTQRKQYQQTKMNEINKKKQLEKLQTITPKNIIKQSRNQLKQDNLKINKTNQKQKKNQKIQEKSSKNSSKSLKKNQKNKKGKLQEPTIQLFTQKKEQRIDGLQQELIKAKNNLKKKTMRAQSFRTFFDTFIPEKLSEEEINKKETKGIKDIGIKRKKNFQKSKAISKKK